MSNLQPEAASKIQVVNQSVSLHPPIEFDIRSKLQVSKQCLVILLMGGLRPVKDQLFLLETFSNWHQHNTSIRLVLVGPPTDPDYAKGVEEIVKRSPGVHLIHGLSRTEAHTAMRNCFAVVNTSLSEGVSQVLLEAMSLGKSVPLKHLNLTSNTALHLHHRSARFGQSSSRKHRPHKSWGHWPTILYSH